MRKERLCACVVAFLVVVLMLPESSDGKKVVIHMPYKVKNFKHTHTIYKVIPHVHEEKADEHVEETEEFDHFKK